MPGKRILVVEDEPDIVEVLRYNLEKEGFEVAVEQRGDAAVESIRRQPPDLVVLDLMLPGLDGLEVVRLLQRERDGARLPIVMLTARNEEVDRIVGFELGADDYIPKPFSPREVVLRIKAILRRAEPEPGSSRRTLRAGPLTLDVDGHLLSIGSGGSGGSGGDRHAAEAEEIELTATEFRLLKLLMERTGRVQTRGQLLSDAWGYAEDVDSRTVDTHVRRLRRKLGRHGQRIETVIGVGYRFRA